MYTSVYTYFDIKIKEPKPIDPALLQKGDLFRGGNWNRGGKNHVFVDIITLTNGDMLVAASCNHWFFPDIIHMPLPDKTENNCKCCQKRRNQM